MFRNPLFEAWIESLEDRRLRSGTGAAAPAPAPGLAESPENPWLHGDLTVDGGADATPAIVRQLRELADERQRALQVNDDAFVTEWFLPAADDGPNAV
jgi:hypothetical protein